MDIIGELTPNQKENKMRKKDNVDRTCIKLEDIKIESVISEKNYVSIHIGPNIGLIYSIKTFRQLLWEMRCFEDRYEARMNCADYDWLIKTDSKEFYKLSLGSGGSKNHLKGIVHLMIPFSVYQFEEFIEEFEKEAVSKGIKLKEYRNG